MEFLSDSVTSCNWQTLYSHQIIDRGTRGLGN